MAGTYERETRSVSLRLAPELAPWTLELDARLDAEGDLAGTYLARFPDSADPSDEGTFRATDTLRPMEQEGV